MSDVKTVTVDVYIAIDSDGDYYVAQDVDDIDQNNLGIMYKLHHLQITVPIPQLVPVELILRPKKADDINAELILEEK